MEYLGIFLGSGGIIGVIGLFFYMGKWFGKIDERFNAIDYRFHLMEKRFDAIDKRFEEVNKRFDDMGNEFKLRFDIVDKKFEAILFEIRALTSRLDRLEVRVEERTLKVVKFQKPNAENDEIQEN